MDDLTAEESERFAADPDAFLGELAALAGVEPEDAPDHDDEQEQGTSVPPWHGLED